jgi:GNAT superfamily N-acetyltransferase
MTIRMLLPVERVQFEEHLRRLDYNDRMMRFESSVSDDYLARYVAGIDLSRDAIFGYFDEQCVLRGAAHIAFHASTADLGLSVETGHRHHGVGSNLLQKAVDWSRFRATRFSTQCLTHNRWMIKRLTKMGFAIEYDRETAMGTKALDAPDMELTYKIIAEEQIDWLSYGTKLFFTFVLPKKIAA